ncbi:4-phosphopantetheinyl transferase [Flavobacterium aquidurense]|jgi:4'-phosphopantetheinyl transferase|uniref:4'-phosphopantetheinyl transferase family protein n=1 Tax=Flavobacterium aquidurense TaxID=362413 RepID=UPI000914FED2|nr:4'-phosphopantetheinyl transferase superfamily protein [Flavobacterium aquidurense]OXA72855.1 4-phosphopantetheinyl transferase [Flavobacterium aquidurense]SHG08365.1 Phosphopantetheinyl transferase [Flavobacterium frigidimaris]
MPLFQTIQFNETTKILIWHITESFEELLSKVVLKEKTQQRLDGMKSQMHQRAFLSVRMLIQEMGFTDHEMHYDEFGKPYFNCHNHISITHSHDFAAIIISHETVGIDMELQREKILRIADKFVDTENSYLNTQNTTDYIKELTVIWGAKEAIFKIRNEKGISFKDHIRVNAFSLKENLTEASLHFDDLVVDFNVHYKEIKSSTSWQDFTLVYAFEK